MIVLLVNSALMISVFLDPAQQQQQQLQQQQPDQLQQSQQPLQQLQLPPLQQLLQQPPPLQPLQPPLQPLQPLQLQGVLQSVVQMMSVERDSTVRTGGARRWESVTQRDPVNCLMECVMMLHTPPASGVTWRRRSATQDVRLMTTVLVE